MTEPAERSAAERLDELAAVTREYAAHSSEKLGLAYSAVGAWWIATFLVALRSETWGRIAALWAPMIAVGLVSLGRRYYQRFGEVLAREPWPRGSLLRWRKSVWRVALLIAWVVVATAWRLETWSGGSAVAFAALIGILGTAPVVPLLAARMVVGFWDDAVMFVSVGTAQMLAAVGFAGGELFRWMGMFMLGVTAAGGVGLVGVGVHQHLRYRRLERRLAALKELA